IFDRVRENLPLMRRSSIKDIINTSLWETVRRSLATTIITLLPVGALFLFGGEVLKDFAFAILIGISISAFSTIFIAAPFLAVLLEHAPEYKGRAARERLRADDEGPEPDGGTPARRRRPKPKPSPTGAEAPAALMGDGAEARGEPAASPAFGELAPEPAASAQSKRDRRRQRRRTRPHGRAR
ncbi:MAG: hypothetical protein ACRDM9_13550, partial [Gaiellaceae bacterium]